MRDAEDDNEHYAYPTQRMWKLNIFYKIIYKFFFISNNVIVRICGTPMGNSRHTLWEPLSLTTALSLRHPTSPSPYHFHLSVI
jgi:hypothetical protein